MKQIHPAGKRCLQLWLIALLITPRAFSQIVPLPHAYAHNDYWHKRPLFDALSNGFTHIEADVYLRHSRLLVAHRPPLLKKKSTVEELYLQPLLERFKNEVGMPPSAMDTIVLMVDIKSNGRRTYAALKKVLKNYESILSTCDNGHVVIRNVTLVLTGHRPMDLLRAERSRFVFADKDLKKISQSDDRSADMFTIASCKYSSVIRWKGKGTIPPEEKDRLEELVAMAHLSGQKVRLWASPEKEKVWAVLRNCGVDLINTDKLLSLKKFFIKQKNFL